MSATALSPPLPGSWGPAVLSQFYARVIGCLFRNLDTTGGAEGLLQVTWKELAGGKGGTEQKKIRK